MTDNPPRRAPAVRISDLLATARDCAEGISSNTREAVAAVRDGSATPLGMQSTMILAEAWLDSLPFTAEEPAPHLKHLNFITAPTSRREASVQASKIVAALELADT